MLIIRYHTSRRSIGLHRDFFEPAALFANVKRSSFQPRLLFGLLKFDFLAVNLLQIGKQPLLCVRVGPNADSLIFILFKRHQWLNGNFFFDTGPVLNLILKRDLTLPLKFEQLADDLRIILIPFKIQLISSLKKIQGRLLINLVDYAHHSMTLGF